MNTTALVIRDENHYLETVSQVRELVERIETVGDVTPWTKPSA